MSVANIPSGCSEILDYSCAAPESMEEKTCVICPTTTVPTTEPVPVEVVEVCGNGVCEEEENMLGNCDPDCTPQPATNGGTSAGDAVTIDTTESDEGTTEGGGGGEATESDEGTTGNGGGEAANETSEGG